MSLIALATWAGFGLAAAGAIAVGYALNRRPVVFADRQAVMGFAAIWLGALLFEFYALGPASYVSMTNDGSLGATFYTFLVDRHLGGQFAHGYGGGHDADAVLGFGTQLFSLERIFFSLLPTWLAIFALKLVVALTGFIGAYKLCRITGPAGRTVSAGLAAVFTLAVPYIINATTWNVLGYSVLPWVIYFAAAREDRRHYLPGLVVLGLLAATAEPLHTFVTISGTVVAGAVLLGKLNAGSFLRSVVLPIAVIIVFTLANWHEVFYAMKQISPLTIRGNIPWSDLTVTEAATNAISQLAILKVGAAGMAVSILVFAYRRESFGWNAVAAVAALSACYLALTLIPWETVGLGFVNGLSPHYLFFSTPALMLPMAARVAATAENGNPRPALAGPRWPAATVFAIAAALLIFYKVENGAKLAYYGGQSQYTTIDNLATRDWGTDEPFRVVTLRHQRPEPEVLAAFYGLDTYDSALSLTSASYSIYWRDGILKGKGKEGFFGRLTLERRHDKDGGYDAEEQADIALLGAANVGFIVSPVPLKGGVRLVSGPALPPARPDEGLIKFARDRLSRVFHYGKVYVYAVADPLPRAFAARGLRRIAPETEDKEFLKVVSDLAPARIAVVRGSGEALSESEGLLSMRVREITKTVNGYDVAIDAPDGGVLVLNVPPLPFWKAFAATGKQMDIFPVNMVHMAVAVPEGTLSVSFRYNRPTIRQRVLAFLRELQ